MMSENISLKKAEQKAFRSTFLDGLYDMLWGTMIFSLVLSGILRDLVGVPLNYLPVLLVLVLGIPGVLAGKKWLVTPRMGLVKFGPHRKKKLNRVRWILIVIFVFTLTIFLLPYLNQGDPVTVSGPYWIVDATAGLFVLAIFSFLATAMEQPRMYIYGLLLGLSMPFDEVFEHAFGLDWMIGTFVAGAVMLVTGIVIFSRFLRDYPLPEGAVYDGSNG
jgi:hypothetical protein